MHNFSAVIPSEDEYTPIDFGIQCHFQRAVRAAHPERNLLSGLLLY